MAVRLIRKWWWVDFRVDNIRYRKRSPDNSRAGAIAYESMLRRKLVRGEDLDKTHDPVPKELRFGEFAWKWFDEYVVTNNKYSEQRTKKYILSASLIPFFERVPLGEITAHQIEQYKAKQLETGILPKTVNNRLTVLAKCLAMAREWSLTNSEPPRIRRLRCPPPRTDYLTFEESARLLANAEGVTREMIFTALRTGMRQGELKGLQWASIDWEARILTVRHSRCDYRKVLDSPKSNRERYIPLDSELYEQLAQRKQSSGYVFVDSKGKPFDYKRLGRRLAGVCERAGMRRIGWHVLRHTFASHLSMKSVPLPVVQSLLGHSTIVTTMRYTHVAPSALKAAIDQLNQTAWPDANFGQPVGNASAERRSMGVNANAAMSEEPLFSALESVR